MQVVAMARSPTRIRIQIARGVQFVWTYTYTVECYPITLRVFLEAPYWLPEILCDLI